MCTLLKGLERRRGKEALQKKRKTLDPFSISSQYIQSLSHLHGALLSADGGREGSVFICVLESKNESGSSSKGKEEGSVLRH
jgi:hypothetical protein